MVAKISQIYLEFLKDSHKSGTDVIIMRTDPFLKEQLYDILVYVIQNPNASDLESKPKRMEDIGKDLYADGGADAMENMFYSIEFRIKDEIGKDAKLYRSWWNNISPEWNY